MRIPTSASPPKENRHPYPSSKQESSDEAEGDKGWNFGRIARAGILDEYISGIKAQDYLGVRILHWIAFFKAMSETSTDEQIGRKLEALRTQIQSNAAPFDGDKEHAQYREVFLEVVERFEELWKKTP